MESGIGAPRRRYDIVGGMDVPDQDHSANPALSLRQPLRGSLATKVLHTTFATSL